MGDEDLRVSAPPHDTQAEIGVLGSMILAPHALKQAGERLTVASFYTLAHQKVFTAIIDIYQARGTLDIILLRDKLSTGGSLEQVGGVKYLNEIMDMVPTSANVEHYIRIVQEKAAQRAIMQIGLLFFKKAAEQNVNWEEFNDEIAGVFSTFDRGAVTVPLIAEHLKVATERMEKRARGEDTGLRTGLGPVDSKIGGIEPGELVLLLGESSSGKTAFLSNILLDLTARRKGTALFFSAEVIGPTLAIDLARIIGQRDFWRLRRDGRLSQEDFQAWQCASATLGEAQLFVDDTPGISVEELVNRAGVVVEKHAVSVVAVDYVQLLTTEKRCESEVLRIDHIGRTLKRFAGRSGVPVILLSQMSVTDGRRDPRYCKALMQMADVRIDLLRGNGAHDKEPENEPPVCERKVVLAKGRHKGTGWSMMMFDKPTLTFYEEGQDGRRDGRPVEADTAAGAGQGQAQAGERAPSRRTQGTLGPGGGGPAPGTDKGEDVPDGDGEDVPEGLPF